MCFLAHGLACANIAVLIGPIVRNGSLNNAHWIIRRELDFSPCWEMHGGEIDAEKVLNSTNYFSHQSITLAW